MRAPITMRMRRPRKSARPRPDCDKQVMLPDPTGEWHGWTREAALILQPQHCIGLYAMARRWALALSVALACAPAWAGPPLEPSVATMEAIGQPGGDLQMLAASSQDTRLLVVYGYARLVGYDRDLNLVPDILSAVEVEDGRVFTLRLREGHRWSDGAPFTTEDFRYYWEDVANNEQLSPVRAAPGVAGRRRAADRSRSWIRSRSATAGPRRTPSSCRRWPAPDRCSSTCPRTI